MGGMTIRKEVIMIDFLNVLTSSIDGKIGVLLTVLTILLTIDMIVGSTVAKIDSAVQFTSYKLKTGILVKITELLLCIIAIPFAVMVDGGLQFLVIGLLALCAAEVYSILGNLRIVDDGKEGLNILESLFKNLLGKKEK